jgi:enoyl-CoA hydratase/carnithine racemase
MMQQPAPASEKASTPVLVIEGARATIRLNRPKHLNRLQVEDLEALKQLFDRIEADPAIRVLVLTGTGRAFSAGYDLNSVAERGQHHRAAERGLRLRGRGQPPGGIRRADHLPAQWRRVWRLD